MVIWGAMKKIANYEIIDLRSGNTIGFARTAQEVETVAADMKDQYDILFLAFDETGLALQTWPIEQILNGTFESDVRRFS